MSATVFFFFLYIYSCSRLTGDDSRSWTLGWITASNLSPLDFDDPDSERIPFFREARDYFISHILCQRNLEHVGLRQTQWSPDRRETGKAHDFVFCAVRKLT